MLRIAAMLHDVGKVTVPDRILCKPDTLTGEEFEQIKKHSIDGAEIVALVEGLAVIVPWIRHSHERFDGSGYPDGLQGEAIPQASRIMLVADAFDAITSSRPYRDARTVAHAREELERNAGTPVRSGLRRGDARADRRRPREHGRAADGRAAAGLRRARRRRRSGVSAASPAPAPLPSRRPRSGRARCSARNSRNSSARPCGSSRWGKWAARGKRPEQAAGDRLVGATAMCERDRVVALAPHDHRRQQLEQVRRSVASTRCPCTSITARSVCRKAPRRFGVLQRAQRPRDRLQVDARADAALAQARARSRAAPPSSARMDRQRQQQRHSRQRRRAQQRADLAAEPAAGDQHEALDALRELVEELHRHAAAERVPDERRAVDADRGEQVTDARGVRAERVVAARRRRVAVPDQIGRHDRVFARRAAERPPASGSRS